MKTGIRIVKGEEISPIFFRAMFGSILMFMVLATVASLFSGAIMRATGLPQPEIIALFFLVFFIISIPYGIKSTKKTNKYIKETNWDYVIDWDNGILSYPVYENPYALNVERKAIVLSEIESIFLDQDSEVSVGSHSGKVYSDETYYLNIIGLFGAVQLKVHDKLTRDELRAVLSQAVTV